jgi:inosine-uridine nucleoside N-ribohydrolase
MVFGPIVGALVAVAFIPALGAAPPSAPKIILDTDIGDDVDDAYALALVASRPGVRLLGVTTAYGETAKRAELAAKLLSVMGCKDVPVCAGRANANKIGRQHEWARGFQSRSMLKLSAVEFMKREIERYPGEVILVPIGALTNVGDLLTQHPDLKPKIKQIVMMGGAAFVGYGAKAPAEVEWNIRCDPQAATTVFESGVPIVMAGLDATTMMQLDSERQKRMAAHGTPTTDAIAALRELWGNPTPTLFDPVAVAYACGHRFADEQPVRIRIEGEGMTRVIEGAPNAIALVKPRKDEFLDWYVEAMRRTP